MAKNIINEWRFELVTNKNTIDVSKNILRYVNKNSILKINSDLEYKNLIKNKQLLTTNSYLKISKYKDKSWEPLSINQNCKFNLRLGKLNIDNPIINIVYFLNADISACYFKLFKDQLKDLIKSGILINRNLKLYLVIICSNDQKKLILKKIISDLKLNQYCEINISFSEDVHKEYEGINKVWEISTKQNKKNSFVFYIHGKGLSYLQNKFLYIRQPLEKFLFKLIIYKWKRNIELLSRFESINKIGSLSGIYGWLWFNFWIARTSYIAKLEKPVKRNRACYYEDWLARYELKKTDRSLKTYKNIFNDSYYNTVNQNINLLSNPKKMKYNIGSYCEVKKGDFVLGFVKLSYHIWYRFFVVMSKLRLNNADKDRLIFF
tara:strand:+ start:1866 stop:2996 length:1131 start_codon:yes stop_codon:yes gene_type:complete